MLTPRFARYLCLFESASSLLGCELESRGRCKPTARPFIEVTLSLRHLPMTRSLIGLRTRASADSHSTSPVSFADSSRPLTLY